MSVKYTYDDEARCGYLNYNELPVTRTIVLHNEDEGSVDVNIDVHDSGEDEGVVAVGVEFLFVDTVALRRQVDLFVVSEAAQSNGERDSSPDANVVLEKVRSVFNVEIT